MARRMFRSASRRVFAGPTAQSALAASIVPAQEPHHGGEDLPPRQVAGAQVALDPLADVGEDLAELEHAAELRLVPGRPVERVVAILLAPPRVPRRRLDVADGIGADPDVGPC